MSMIRVVIDQSKLDQYLTGAQGEAVRLVKDAQRLTLNAARKRAPVDTGQLRVGHVASNVQVSGNKVTGNVEARQEYAMAVHEGSRPHIIRPKNASVLTFKIGGTRVFAKSVKHPGAKARPWLLNAAKAEAGRLGFAVTEGEG